LKVGYGAFINDESDLKKYALDCNPQPEPSCKKAVVQRLIEEAQDFT